jgi:hypothetical protein
VADFIYLKRRLCAKLFSYMTYSDLAVKRMNPPTLIFSNNSSLMAVLVDLVRAFKPFCAILISRGIDCCMVLVLDDSGCHRGILASFGFGCFSFTRFPMIVFIVEVALDLHLPTSTCKSFFPWTVKTHRSQVIGRVVMLLQNLSRTSLEARQLSVQQLSAVLSFVADGLAQIDAFLSIQALVLGGEGCLVHGLGAITIDRCDNILINKLTDVP